jgi:hypothetical protein
LEPAGDLDPVEGVAIVWEDDVEVLGSGKSGKKGMLVDVVDVVGETGEVLKETPGVRVSGVGLVGIGTKTGVKDPLVDVVFSTEVPKGLGSDVELLVVLDTDWLVVELALDVCD